MNLNTSYKIANSCDRCGQISSPKNAFFECVLALYFCPLVLGHPVSKTGFRVQSKKILSARNLQSLLFSVEFLDKVSLLNITWNFFHSQTKVDNFQLSSNHQKVTRFYVSMDNVHVVNISIKRIILSWLPKKLSPDCHKHLFPKKSQFSWSQSFGFLASS